MSSDIAVSIVIPVYNVAAYLQETLDSVAGQTFEDFEVILMDDGSSDGSADIAKAFAGRDSRFRYVRKDNEGVSVTRNRAIELAKGRYLLLVDSDDILPQKALESLYRAAEDNEADVVTGKLMHLRDGVYTTVRMSEMVFSGYRHRTTMKESPGLAFDSITCGKLIRRSYWDGLGLKFPVELSYCEDMPLAFRLYANAKTVIMLDETVYLWRVRGEESRSATQSISMRMIEERLTSLRMIDDIIREEGVGAGIVRQKKMKSLLMDFNILVNKIVDMEDEEMDRAMSLIGGYMKEDGLAEEFRNIPVIYAEKYRALMKGDRGRLRKLRAFQTDRQSSIICRRAGKKILGVFPSAILPLRVADMKSSVAAEPLRLRVKTVTAADGRITAGGCAYIRYLPVREPRDVKMSAWIKDGDRERVRQLRIEQCPTKTPFGIEKKSNSNRVAYAGAGYVITVAKEDFAGLRPGSYRIFIEWEACGEKREAAIYPFNEEQIGEITGSRILEGAVSSIGSSLRKEPIFTVG